MSKKLIAAVLLAAAAVVTLYAQQTTNIDALRLPSWADVTATDGNPIPPAQQCSGTPTAETLCWGDGTWREIGFETATWSDGGVFVSDNCPDMAGGTTPGTTERRVIQHAMPEAIATVLVTSAEPRVRYDLTIGGAGNNSVAVRLWSQTAASVLLVSQALPSTIRITGVSDVQTAGVYGVEVQNTSSSVLDLSFCTDISRAYRSAT